MNSKRVKMVFIVVIMMVVTMACGLLGQSPGEAPDLPQPTIELVSEKFPFEGIWFEQDRTSMLVITAEVVYLHEFDIEREVYARIDAVDLDAATIDVFVSGIFIGGMSMGYDSPNLQIRYHINGTALEFWGQHLDAAPDEEGPVIYILDEFLNSGK